MRVLAAMSGGVDSSVAAALMVEAGHEVIGVTLKLWQGEAGEMPTHGCCTLADTEDARRVAGTLGIPYYVLDATDEFRRGIVDPFIDEYAAGRTPNPCIECNRVIKFAQLLGWAEELGCDLVVTGHYARVVETEDRYRLLRGADPRKDQSYVLYMLGQQELAKVRFPVGSQTKAATRRLADTLDLRTAYKQDSQDICFVDGDYRSFLRRHNPDAFRAGPIVDTDGTVVSTHDGIGNFTIGQRKGLGVAFGEARYVVDMDPATATVTIGRRSEASFSGVKLGSPTWVDRVPPVGSPVDVQLRAHGAAKPAMLDADGVTVRFDEPREAVAAGQAAVLYDGDMMLGGGTIIETFRVPGDTIL